MAGSAPAREEMLARVRIVRELGNRMPGTYLGHRDGDGEQDVVLETYADADSPAVVRVGELARKIRDAPPHPHVIAVLSAERIGPGISIVTDFVDGVPLDDVFFGMSTGARLRAVVDVLAALSAIHAAGVVHGGILRACCFVEKNGRIKLGFSYRQPMCTRKETHAPEALAGDETSIDARADVYGAGVMLWEAVSGRALFRDETPEQLVEKQRAGRVEKALPTRRDRWARTLLPVIERALALDPTERFASAAEMAAAVRIAVRARLMMHEDVIEEIWPAETKPKHTSGIQPVTPQLVAIAAFQVESQPSVAADDEDVVEIAEHPLSSELPRAPLAMTSQAPREGASSGIVPLGLPRPSALPSRRRILVRAIALATAAVVVMAAGVAAVTLVHRRAPANAAAHADAMAEPHPNSQVSAPAVATPTPAAPASASDKPAAKPAASQDRAAPRRPHRHGKHPASARDTYDPSEI